MTNIHIRAIPKITFRVIFGMVCVFAALLLLIYSSWSQEMLRRYVVETMSDGDTRISIERLRILFPLDVEALGIKVAMADMNIEAGELKAEVQLFPLLSGNAKVDNCSLEQAHISLGAPDSAMYLTVNANKIALSNTSVGLKNLDIDVCDGHIDGGRISMTLNQDTAAVADSATTERTAMNVNIHRLSLDDFAYTMRMLPTIDSLSTVMATAQMTGGKIDLFHQTIDIETFTGSQLNVGYIAPDSATVAETPVIAQTTDSESLPWTITIDSIAFDKSKALYTTRGITPMPGLDFAYISLDSLDLSINNFYNQASTLRVPLSVSGIERCGVDLTVKGILDITESGLAFYDFTYSTNENSDLKFSGLLGMGDLVGDRTVPVGLKVKGFLAPRDMQNMFPAFTPYFITLPRNNRLYTLVDVNGTSGNLHVNKLDLAINECAKLQARGRLINVFDPAHIGGNLALSGAMIDLNPMKDALLDQSTAEQINFPMTTFSGSAKMHDGAIDGGLTAITEQGEISLDATWSGESEEYTVNLTTNKFPLHAFMPLLGVGELTAKVEATGQGVDIFSPKTTLTAQLDVEQAVYQGYDYRHIDGEAKIANGHADINLNSHNPNARFNLQANGNLIGELYEWQAEINGAHVDLMALGNKPEKEQKDANMSGNVAIDNTFKQIDGNLSLSSLSYTDQIGTLTIGNVQAMVNANDSATNLSVYNRDLYAFVSADASIDSIMASMTKVSEVLADEMSTHVIDIKRIHQALPPFAIDINGGNNNFVGDIMADSRMKFKSLHVVAINDTALSFDAGMLGLESETMRLDTISLNIAQVGERADIKGRINNRPGTFDEWAHVDLNGYLADNQLGLNLRQSNIQGVEGYAIGMNVNLTDSIAIMSIKPFDPTIAYKPWSVNEDNYISYAFATKHIDANLHMRGGESSLAIYTNHVEGHETHKEELVVNLANIKLSDWMKFNPFAPPMTGNLNADLHLRQHDQFVLGRGSFGIDEFYYDRQRVGSISSDFGIATNMGGQIYAKAGINIDGVQRMTLAGALNDSTAGSPLALDFSMIHFPLNTVNPFLPKNIAQLSGTLNGQMDITGSGDKPKINGWLQFDSTEVKVNMVGASYSFSPVKIPVDSNVVRFNDFAINGVNGRPLSVNGSVDIADMANPKIDLKLSADNFQICNSSRAQRGAEVYGKGFISTNTTVKGNADFMMIKANLSVLSGTNITYLMTDAQSVIASQSVGEMVKFVNFSDTSRVISAEKAVSTMAMMVDASLTVQSGSTINVDLSSNGRDRVRLQPEGTLNFSMPPFGDPRLTGRLNINSGFARYTPPFMSEKMFNFSSDSYVAFNGEMMNPTLNLHAIDVVKANVNHNGQGSQNVNFNVGLDVTGTLSQMNVSFDLSTTDNITIANELQSMSAEQRANQAMNLLLYNVYTGPGTSTESDLSSSALYSFLSSQLNSWAARTIKGVDLSFGIDQYSQSFNGSTSTGTSYSYEVSKSLFNDRFKIVVGGNYSTDANADENFSQNLIKDISFEYFLNSAQTMYVRLFRHTGYESILEGEITKTGVGFVFKRKLTSLRHLFRFRRPRQNEQSQQTSQPTQQSENVSL